MIRVTESYEAEKELIYSDKDERYGGYYKSTEYPRAGIHGREYRAGYYVLYISTKKPIGSYSTTEGAIVIPVENPNKVLVRSNSDTLRKFTTVEGALKWIDDNYVIDTNSNDYNHCMSLINAYIKLRDSGELKTPEECLAGMKTQNPQFTMITDRINEYKKFIKSNIDKASRAIMKGFEGYGTGGRLSHNCSIVTGERKKRSDTKFKLFIGLPMLFKDEQLSRDTIMNKLNDFSSYLLDHVIVPTDNIRIISVSEPDIYKASEISVRDTVPVGTIHSIYGNYIYNIKIELQCEVVINQ